MSKKKKGISKVVYDMLGLVKPMYNKEKIINLINDENFINCLKKAPPVYRILFIKAFGLYNYMKTNDKLNELIKNTDEEKISTLLEQAKKEIYESEGDEIEKDDEVELGDEDEDVDSSEDLETTVSSEEVEKFKDSTDYINTITDLDDAKIMDNLSSTYENVTYADDIIEFFISSQVNFIWNALFNNENGYSLEELRNDSYEGHIFQETKIRFLEEYESCEKLEKIDGYESHEPSLMQKLTTIRLVKNRHLGNWSGTGCGKTLSAILFSGYLRAEVTLIICLNSTIDGWCKEIDESFPNKEDKEIHVVNMDEDLTLSKGKMNFVLLNYEKFQQQNSQKFVDSILSKIKIDFLVLDEIQFMKQRTDSKKDDNLSIRKLNILKLRQELQKRNKELYVLGMTATPLINNLVEVQKLLEFLTLNDYTNGEGKISTRKTINNCIDYHIQLMNNGIRLKKKLEISEIKPREVEINGSDNITQLDGRLEKNGILTSTDIEEVFFDLKMDLIISNIKKRKKEGHEKHIIYTENIACIVDRMNRLLKSHGFKPSVYIGGKENQLSLMTKEGYERKKEISKSKNIKGFTLPREDLRFIDGTSDVLIASSCIGTGVDGLQKICSSINIFTLPWTSAAFEQLIGRLRRQGYNLLFKTIDVFIPLVYIEKDGIKKSIDIGKWNTIKNKKSLSDACVDGNIPDSVEPSKNKLTKEFSKVLNDNTKEFLISERIKSFDSPMFEFETLDSDNKRKKTRLKILHDNLRSLTSNKYKKDKKKKKELEEYHVLRDELKKNWELDPADYLYDNYISKIKGEILVDFGCGRNTILPKLEQHNIVYSFDHAQLEESVIECDVTDVSEYLEDNSVSFVICCLSMWGTNSNKEAQLKEAYRILKHGGRLFYIDTQDNIKSDEILEILTDIDFDISDKNISSRFDLKILTKF